MNAPDTFRNTPRTGPLQFDPHVWQSTLDAAERVLRRHLAAFAARGGHGDQQNEHVAAQDESESVSLQS